MSKKLFLVILIVSIFFILSAVEGFAAVPQKMNFQGRLLNISNPGSPTPETGGKTVYFAIKNEADDITHWNSTQSVSCDSQGQFSTVLDLSVGQSLTNPLDFSKPLYLRVEYPVGSLLGPRQPLETVPYAFYAVSAETANVAHTAESVLGSTPAGGWKDSGITVELVTPTDRVGIGTSYPAGALHVSSEASPNALVVKSGKVGIGTAEPLAKLDFGTSVANAKIVIGTHMIGPNALWTGIGMDSTSAGIRLAGDISGPLVDIGYYSSDASHNWASKVYVQGSTGNVGLGVIPLSKLHIYGAAPVLRITDSGGDGSSSGISFRANDESARWTLTALKYNDTNSDRFEISSAQNVCLVLLGTAANNAKAGLYRSDPQYPWQVGYNTNNGNAAYVTAAGVWTDGSSRTFKEDYREINKAELLNKVLKFSIYNFKYKESTSRGIGPFAEDFYDAFGLGDNPKYLSPEDVAGVALVAIQEQQKQIEEQKLKIQQLESRIEALERK
jgi:hypothetical protein